jgi:hypothetical protein
MKKLLLIIWKIDFPEKKESGWSTTCPNETAVWRP